MALLLYLVTGFIYNDKLTVTELLTNLPHSGDEIIHHTYLIQVNLAENDEVMIKTHQSN